MNKVVILIIISGEPSHTRSAAPLTPSARCTTSTYQKVTVSVNRLQSDWCSPEGWDIYEDSRVPNEHSGIIDHTRSLQTKAEAA